MKLPLRMACAAMWFVIFMVSHGWWHWVALSVTCLYVLAVGAALHGRKATP